MTTRKPAFFVSLLFVLALVVFALAITTPPAKAYANQGGKEVAAASVVSAQESITGTWGTCPWTIDDQGTLTVRPGRGEDFGTHSPWGAYSGSIKKVVFATGADDSKVVAPSSSGFLFYLMDKIESVDLKGLDTSGVTDLQNAFYGCSALQSVDVTGLDTSNITGIGGLFGGCTQLTEVTGFGDLDLSNASSLIFTFYNCSSIPAIDLSCLAGARITNGASAFEGCAAATVIDLSGIDTSQMFNAEKMFYNCKSLKTVYVDEGWSVANVTYSDYMFVGCTSIVGGQGTTYDQSHAAAQWARIDGVLTSATPGYLTYKKATVKKSISSATVTLSATSFTYNGAVQKPTVASVKLGDKTLSASSDYTVSYSSPNSKDVGSYTITVIGQGSYRGSKSATYKIDAAVNPKPTPTPGADEPAVAEIVDLPAVKIAKLKAGKKSATVSWKKVSKKRRKAIQGIEVQYSADNFATIAGTKYAKKTKTSLKLKKLAPKKKYKVRIRAYRNGADGKHVSPWKTKSVKVK